MGLLAQKRGRQWKQRSNSERTLVGEKQPAEHEDNNERARFR